MQRNRVRSCGTGNGEG